MKLLITALFLMFSLLSSAEEANKCEQLKKDGASIELLAQRGCCSWHGGVCGCSGGRVSCCDGSLSPSCGCHAEDVKKEEPKEADVPKS